MAGRPRVDRISIIPPADVLDDTAIRAEYWRTVTLAEHLRTPETAMVWLAKHRLLKNSVLCVACDVPCKLKTNAKGVDGKRWRCDICHGVRSIRDKSFFTRSHLTLHQITILMYCFSHDFPQNKTMIETDIARADTVMEWFNFCREDISRFLENHATGIGGFDEFGQPKVVEIDESKYFHRKYHRGAFRDGHWVFGGVERESGKCFLVEVPDRSAATLEAKIVQHILPGTVIMSDGWAAYRNIGQLQHGIYDHSVVVHDRNFVDPDDSSIHTQNIENLWMRAKRKLKRQCGTSRTLFPSYLREFEFRSIVGTGNIFAEFMLVIAEMYPM